MRLFLTGASGFLGKNFYKEALKQGHFIYATSRKKNRMYMRQMFLSQSLF